MKKVLIVDDAPDSRLTLRTLLSNHNVEVIEASDGLEGWEMIIKERPDLILLDLYMPNKDGFEVLRDLEEEWLGIPVVVVSGDNTYNTIDSCLSYGASAFVQKPIVPKDFNEAIKTINVQ
jgi:CheY-like chemotaxis protein